eukprot:gene11193-4013_t
MGSNNSKTASEENSKVLQEWIQTCTDNDIKKAEDLIKQGKHKYYENDKTNPSPLHVCVQSPKITKILLNSGIPVNLGSPLTMSTPLHFAAFHNVDETTKLLLENGADTMKFDFDGVHPYLYARERNAYKSMFHIRQEMLKINKGDFINTWRQVCRPELQMLQKLSESEPENSDTQMGIVKHLENCVSYSFCLPERKALENADISSQELEDKYMECLNKNQVKL